MHHKKNGLIRPPKVDFHKRHELKHFLFCDCFTDSLAYSSAKHHFITSMNLRLPLITIKLLLMVNVLKLQPPIARMLPPPLLAIKLLLLMVNMLRLQPPRARMLPPLLAI